jgi:SAM-dependent methyltransferase
MTSETRSLGEQNYEQFADRYAAFAPTKPHNAYYDRPAVISLLPDVRGLKVLDAGCGPGIYSEWLLEHGAEVVAVDVTPRMVELARERTARFGERVQVLRADLTAPLDFAGADAFDLVVSPLVMDYVGDWEPVLAEFKRVLRAGGQLVLSVGHPFGDWLWIQKYVNPSSNYFARELFEVRWDGFGEPEPLIRSYRRPLADMLNPLARAGFFLEQVLEPLPTEDFRRAAPADYQKLLERPGFICLRARKPALP